MIPELLTESTFKIEHLVTAMNDHGIDLKRATVLIQVCGPKWRQGITMSHIATVCRFSTAAATGLVDSMAEAGFVTTYKPATKAEGDRRATYVKATPAGGTLLRQMIAQASHMGELEESQPIPQAI